MSPRLGYSIYSHPLVGTSWQGASGAVATVERVEGGIVIGQWDSGVLWSEHEDQLLKLYARAPAVAAPPPSGVSGE